VRLLGQAVEAYLAALQVYTREALPQQWAGTQNNLARTYLQLLCCSTLWQAKTAIRC
jgi:hypothetical protein